MDRLVNGEMNDILKNVTNNNNIHLQKIGDNTLLSILSTGNKKYNPNLNMSSIDLGECENELKEIYNITEPLIIVKIDYKQNDSLIPIIEYKVYHPITKELLNLSLCVLYIYNRKWN